MAVKPTKATPGTDVAVKEVPSGGGVVISAQSRTLFASMVTMVPQAEDDASDRILLAILQAETWDDLDNPWDTEKSAAMVDLELRIDGITRHESAYADGLGVFLVLHGKRMDDDEPVTFACGALSVVGQMVRAYALGSFPVYGFLRKAAKPTRRGYYPLHFEFTAAAGSALPAPGMVLDADVVES